MDAASLAHVPTEPQVAEEPPVELDVDLDAVAAALDGVDAALRRLDEGTYGTCEVCAGPLADERLAVDPVVRRCPEHEGAAAPVTSMAPPPAAPTVVGEVEPA